MAWSEPEVMCKKHPIQRQQPGVCSSCVGEKLSKLPISLPFNTVPPHSSSFSSSPAACFSSASSSICMSPINHHGHVHGHHRAFSGFAGSNFFVINGRSGLKKSKSITYVTRKRARNVVDGKKKEGFWSKLIRSTSMKTKGVFVHSKSAKGFEH